MIEDPKLVHYPDAALAADYAVNMPLGHGIEGADWEFSPEMTKQLYEFAIEEGIVFS